MVDPEIQKAIESIDKKIHSLQQARNQLALAFGITESASPGQNQASSPVYSEAAPPLQPPPPKPRPLQRGLSDFLIKHGPMSSRYRCKERHSGGNRQLLLKRQAIFSPAGRQQLGRDGFLATRF